MQLYSTEWISAFNEAVAGLDAEPGVSFRMVQVVHGGPGGTVRIALEVTDGRISLRHASPDEPAPQVTVSVSFGDAFALCQGELDPAKLLAAGRVKVRGDLSVLVKGQALMAAAVERLDALSKRTTS